MRGRPVAEGILGVRVAMIVYGRGMAKPAACARKDLAKFPNPSSGSGSE